jgi:hypothetical protein
VDRLLHARAGSSCQRVPARRPGPQRRDLARGHQWRLGRSELPRGGQGAARGRAPRNGGACRGRPTCTLARRRRPDAEHDGGARQGALAPQFPDADPDVLRLFPGSNGGIYARFITALQAAARAAANAFLLSDAAPTEDVAAAMAGAAVAAMTRAPAQPTSAPTVSAAARTAHPRGGPPWRTAAREQSHRRQLFCDRPARPVASRSRSAAYDDRRPSRRVSHPENGQGQATPSERRGGAPAWRQLAQRVTPHPHRQR